MMMVTVSLLFLLHRLLTMLSRNNELPVQSLIDYLISALNLTRLHGMLQVSLLLQWSAAHALFKRMVDV